MNPDITTDPLPDDWPALWDLILQSNRDAPEGWQPAGHWSAASRAMLDLYQPLLDAGGRWCVGQLGQSLNGCIATAGGDSRFVTGPDSLLHLHRLRALSDAVLVGAGTVVADDPQLTTRRVPGPQPVRVLLDPAARLDGSARALRDGQAPTWWLCDARRAGIASGRLGATATAEVIAIEGLLDADAFDPGRVIDTLAARGLRRLFVEGGGVTVSRFIEVGCLDRLHLVIAPVLIGAGRCGLQLAPHAAMGDCPRPPAKRHAMGDDMLWDLDLRAPRSAVVAHTST